MHFNWRKSFLVATAAISALVLGSIPSTAQTGPADQDVPKPEARGGPDILLVHGYGDAENGKNCDNKSEDGGTWGDAIEYFSAEGHSHGELKSIGYYVGDKNCKVNLPYDSETYVHNEIPIQQVAADLANYVYDNYTVPGKPVNIIAHSMGGLITRVAVLGSEQGWPDFPEKPIKVSNVVTLSTPHQGISQADKNPDRQWQQMNPDSGFMERLHEDDVGGGGDCLGGGQGRESGPDWTLIGSSEDATVTYDSGIDKGNPANQKFGYQASNDGRTVSHGGVRTLSAGTYDLRYWHPGHPTHKTKDGWSPLKAAYQAATNCGDNLPR